MAKLKVLKKYGVTPNDILNHPDIRLGAKGLWGYIQSKPDNWNFSVTGVVSQCKDGKAAVTGYCKELEQYGLLLRKKFKNKKGQWETDWFLSEEIRVKMDLPDEEEPEKPVDDSGKPPVADYIEAMRPLNDITCNAWFANTTQRQYAELLRQKFSLKEVKYFAELCKLNRGVQLFKNITTPKQLAEGMPSIEKFFLTNGHQKDDTVAAGRGTVM